MAQQFDGKVFVTTAAKAQAVKNLLDYWTMKTDMLRKRQDPTVFASKEVQQKTRDYLINNTKLREQSFFKALNEEKQEKLTKCFNMQDVPKPKKEMVSRNRLKAAVYVCLSGFAVVRNLATARSRRFGAGEVFGSTRHFEQVILEGEEMVDGHPADQGPTEEIIDFSEGTFVRMDLNDVYNTIMKPTEEEVTAIEEAKEHQLATAISGIAWDKMTEQDKFFVRVYQRTKELLNKRFFSFLDSYRMIPKNANMPAHLHYHEGSKGREMYLDRREQTWVFVFIEGSIRVELCTTKTSTATGGHTISYVRKGEESTMHIKKKTMPLLLLSPGAVLCVQPECFALADPPDSDEDDYVSIVSRSHHEGAASPSPSQGGPNQPHQPGPTKASKFRSRFPPSRSRAKKTPAGHDRTVASGGGNTARRHNDVSCDSSAHSARTAQTAASFPSIGSSFDASMHRRADLFAPLASPPEGDDAQYHIKLSFQTNVSYLAVPYANFSRILDDNKLVLPKIAKEIKWYLQSPSDQVKERISRLLPWVQGNIDFNQRGKSDKQLATVDFVPAELGPRGDEILTPLGSFANTQLINSAENSEAGDFRTIAPNLAPSEPAAGKGSKKPDYSFKNATRGSSEKDQTMNSLLQDLRRSRDLNKKSSRSAVKATNMFLTQDGEKEGSIAEESGYNSDSDVDVSDFRPQKTPQRLSPPQCSQFNDSINSTGGEPVLETASLHAPAPLVLPKRTVADGLET